MARLPSQSVTLLLRTWPVAWVGDQRDYFPRTVSHQTGYGPHIALIRLTVSSTSTCPPSGLTTYLSAL